MVPLIQILQKIKTVICFEGCTDIFLGGIKISLICYVFYEFRTEESEKILQGTFYK